MCTEMSRRNQTPAVTNFYRPQTKGRGSLPRWVSFCGGLCSGELGVLCPEGGLCPWRPPPHGGRAGGTHSTGMHSYFGILSSMRDCLLISKLFAIGSRLLSVTHCRYQLLIQY